MGNLSSDRVSKLWAKIDELVKANADEETLRRLLDDTFEVIAKQK